MKYSTLLILVFTLTIMGAYGCSDDSPTNPNPSVTPPTAQAFNALRDVAMDSRTQSAQFNAEDSFDFTSENGVDLHIPAGCLVSNGQPASGSAKLEYVEIFDRANMVVTNKPTMGLTPEGSKKLLISGGEFFINVFQNGEKLEMNCNNVLLKVPGDLTGGADEDMTLWEGATDENGNLAWESVPNDIFVEISTYFAFLNNFGFANVDRFRYDPRPKTTLQVQPPAGYNQDNADVYLSYDGEENALAGLDTFDEETALFTEHYGEVPIGLEMHVIFVTEHNGQYRYAIQGATVAEDDLYTFSLEETQLGTEQDLMDAIHNLP